MDNTVRFRGAVQVPSSDKRVPYVAIISKKKEEWDELPDYMSVNNTLYVYRNYRVIRDKETGEIKESLPAFKIGDGINYVVNLPFATMPITEEDIERWDENTGIDVRIDEDSHNLVFYY